MAEGSIVLGLTTENYRWLIDNARRRGVSPHYLGEEILNEVLAEHRAKERRARPSPAGGLRAVPAGARRDAADE